MSAPVTWLWATGVDFILLNAVVGWSPSTDVRQQEIFFLFSSGPRIQGE